MSNSLNTFIAKFAKQPLKDRVLETVAAVLFLWLVVNVTLLMPQQQKIQHFKQLTASNKTELASVNKALASVESNTAKTSTQQPERANVDDLQKQLAEVNAFFNQIDSSSTSQLETLLKELSRGDPKLMLLSLKTLSSERFYVPEAKEMDQDKPPKTDNQTKKVIYRYGVEISIKGDYPSLLSYMERLQKYPKPLFWAEARLNALDYPNATLKLIINALSDQPSTPLH